MTHLVDDSDMDDELLMTMASAHGHHLLAAGDATYRAAHLSPSLVTQLDDDGDSDLERTRL
jgi:hypothetical protein